jgi:hypothetical protein
MDIILAVGAVNVKYLLEKEKAKNDRTKDGN